MNIQEIMKELSKPFEEDELEFKVMATNSDKTQGLAAVYVQARAIQTRLDSVLGLDKWKVEYKEITGGFLCRLSIKVGDEWISKEDGASVTDFESVKGGISSAFKRVASSGFGIGRYLYSIRSLWFPIKSKGTKGYEFVSAPRINVQLKTNDEVLAIPQKTTIETITIKSDTDKVLDFGKYKGKTLREIYVSDRGYFNYIKKSAKDKEIIELCDAIEKAAS